MKKNLRFSILITFLVLFNACFWGNPVSPTNNSRDNSSNNSSSSGNGNSSNSSSSNNSNNSSNSDSSENTNSSNNEDNSPDSNGSENSSSNNSSSNSNSSISGNDETTKIIVNTNDAKTKDPVNKKTKVTVTGKDKDKVVSEDLEQETETGQVEIRLKKGVSPTPENPIDIALTFEADNHLPTTKPLLITNGNQFDSDNKNHQGQVSTFIDKDGNPITKDENGNTLPSLEELQNLNAIPVDPNGNPLPVNQTNNFNIINNVESITNNNFSINMVNISNPPKGVVTRQFVNVFANSKGIIEKDYDLELYEPSTNITTKVTIRKNTLLADDNGNPVTGDLVTRLTYFSPVVTEALESFPGGLNDVTIVNLKNETQRGNFVTAGLVSLQIRNKRGQVASRSTVINTSTSTTNSSSNLTNNSNRSRSIFVLFSTPRTVSNPTAGGRFINNNDSIGSWRYALDSNQWFQNDQVRINQDGNRFVSLASFNLTNNINYYNLDWFIFNFRGDNVLRCNSKITTELNITEYSPNYRIYKYTVNNIPKVVRWIKEDVYKFYLNVILPNGLKYNVSTQNIWIYKPSTSIKFNGKFFPGFKYELLAYSTESRVVTYDSYKNLSNGKTYQLTRTFYDDDKLLYREEFIPDSVCIKKGLGTIYDPPLDEIIIPTPSPTPTPVPSSGGGGGSSSGGGGSTVISGPSGFAF